MFDGHGERKKEDFLRYSKYISMVLRFIQKGRKSCSCNGFVDLHLIHLPSRFALPQVALLVSLPQGFVLPVRDLPLIFFLPRRVGFLFFRFVSALRCKVFDAFMRNCSNKNQSNHPKKNTRKKNTSHPQSESHHPKPKHRLNQQKLLLEPRMTDLS